MTEHPYHHGDLARALLDAVEEIVLEQGSSHLSLREAARRAGVSHSAPAHHFGDKEGMLRAFATEGFLGLAEALSTAGEAADTVPGRMRAMGQAYVRFAVGHRAHYDVMFRSGLEKESDPALHGAAMAAFAPLAEMVGRIQASGWFPGVPPEHVTGLFWSMVHGLASLWIDGSLEGVYGERLEDLVAGVLDAALEDPTPRPG